MGVALLVPTLLVLAIVVASVVLLARRHSASAEPRCISRERPVLFDANGDGVADAIGGCSSSLASEDRWFAALDGKTGKELWRIPGVPKSVTEGDSRRAIAGDRFITVDASGNVQAYSARNGSVLWKRSFGMKTNELCAGPGLVGVMTRDLQMRALSLDSGADMQSAPRSDCRPTWDSPGAGSPEHRVEPGPHKTDIAGVIWDSTLVPAGGDRVFHLGKGASTGNAMVAAVSADGKLLWKGLVPAIDPELTDGALPVSHYAAGRLVLIYSTEFSHGPLRATCLDAESGKRRWDIAIPDISHNAIAVSEKVFYILEGSGRLVARAMADGSVLWAVP